MDSLARVGTDGELQLADAFELFEEREPERIGSGAIVSFRRDVDGLHHVADGELVDVDHLLLQCRPERQRFRMPAFPASARVPNAEGRESKARSREPPQAE